MSYILYAEDDPDDQQALKDILQDIDPLLEVIVQPTGLALMQYLEGLGRDDQWPAFVVLDMNMPVWDGIRTLKAMKGHHRYAHLPVIIFSTSNLERDAELCLRHGAIRFISKPVKQAELRDVAQQFAEIFRDMFQ